MSDTPRFVVLPLDDDRAPEWARSDFGWFVYDRRHGAYVGDDRGEPEDKSLVRSGFSWVEQALNDVDKEAERTIADLRDRLRAMAQWTCPQCDVTPLGVGSVNNDLWPLCPDCMIALWGGAGVEAACFASGMKALCGRRMLDGGEVK